MAKYDGQIEGLRAALTSAKNILIALPAASSIDKLASALSLSLSLTAQGKLTSVVCDDTITVGQAHLFGIDQVQKAPSGGGNGNYQITLEGVASSNGTVPSLEKLDWFAENNNLNLVFHVMPGQTFNPTAVIPKPAAAGGSYDLVVCLGADSLNSLGSVYSQNQNLFSGVHIANIDNKSTNANFGQTNVIDPNAPSLSEMLVEVMQGLGLLLDPDICTNLLTGIYQATNNLTDPRVNADTFLAVGSCLKLGGQKPGGVVASAQQPVQSGQPQQQPQTFDFSAFMPSSSAQGGSQQSQAPSAQPINNMFFQPGSSQPQNSSESFTNPPVIPSNNPFVTPQSAPTPSQEERPQGEVAASDSGEFEPGWLTPKVFKGSGGVG